MRLNCPKCAAKYEVPDEAIPVPGRDVQCANCGHAWFQTRRPPEAKATARKVEKPPVAVDPPPPPAATIQTAEAADAEDPAADAALAAALDDAPVPAADVALAAATADAPVPATDEKVLAILREEAEREVQARREEATAAVAEAPVTDPVAPLPETSAPPPAPTPEPPQQTADPLPEVLPDATEIRSTLLPAKVREPEAPKTVTPAPRPKNHAFRTGVLVALTLAAVATGAYVAADWLADTVPAFADPLADYVEFVDGLRWDVEGLIDRATRLLANDAA